MLPFRQEIFQVGGFQINGSVELLQVRLLGTLDLPVKVRAAGLIRACSHYENLREAVKLEAWK